MRQPFLAVAGVPGRTIARVIPVISHVVLVELSLGLGLNPALFFVVLLADGVGLVGGHAVGACCVMVIILLMCA